MCAHAARKNKKWEGNIGGLLSSRSKSFFQSLGRNSLLRAPVPPRYESLEGNRAVYDLSAQQMADRFIERNRGKNEFPVKRSHSKELRDELTLTAGDTIILYKVFSDGWAEGVSRRVGGPSIFPVCCLGGSAPLMLQEPDLFRPVTIVTPPRRPRPTHPEPMRMVPGASSMLQAPYIPQRLHQTPLLSNQDSVPYPVTRPLSRFPSASDVGPRHERHHDQPHLLPLQQPDLAVSYNPFKASQIFSPDRDDAESSLSSSSTSSESMGRYLNRDSIYSRPDGYSEV